MHASLLGYHNAAAKIMNATARSARFKAKHLTATRMKRKQNFTDSAQNMEQKIHVSVWKTSTPSTWRFQVYLQVDGGGMFLRNWPED